MNECECRRKRKTLLGLVVCFSLLFYFSKASNKKEVTQETIFEDLVPPNPKKPLAPSASKMTLLTESAVCVDGAACATVGQQILRKNGSAVDAVIATMICNGLVTMQSMGLGGGFFMLIFSKEENAVFSINAREAAPMRANSLFYRGQNSTSDGPLSIAVPGEVKGYLAAHKRFGVLPWKTVVEPSIRICEEGYVISNHQYAAFKQRKLLLKHDENFREWFSDSDGNFKPVGSVVVPYKLCKTLKTLAKNGPDDFYNGEISNILAQDLHELGSLITKEDLKEYEVDWLDPIEQELPNGFKLYTAPPPASGAVLAFIMNILAGYNLTKHSVEGVRNTVTTYHRIIESFKYAYAKRSELGDPRFVNVRKVLKELLSKEHAERVRLKIEDDRTHTDAEHYGGKFYSIKDHGTSHFGVIASNGDAVSVTSSINIFFGSGITSKRTGIVLNNHIDDFSFPWAINFFGLTGSPTNKLEPGKRPISSMSPVIILDSNNNVKLVAGASGGSQITTSVALTLIRILWFGYNVKEAIDAPRIHHQLLPMKVYYEYGVLDKVVEGLKALGHKMERGVNSTVCALKKDDDYIYGNADYRKGGDVLGFY